jgi:deoxycytidylate deaminase
MANKNTIDRRMALARTVSKKSLCNVQMGAVVVSGKSIVGVGFNRVSKTHPISRSQFPGLHAEVDCIIGVDRRHLVGATMYVYREHKDGSLAMSKPCLRCQDVLIESGIKTVYYTTDKGIQKFSIRDLRR